MSTAVSSTAQEKINQALGSLDLTLESELALFRNYRNSNNAAAHEPAAVHEPTVSESLNVSPANVSPDSFSPEPAPTPALDPFPPTSTASDETSPSRLQAAVSDASQDYVLSDGWPLELSDVEASQREGESTSAGALVPSKALVPSPTELSQTYSDPVLDDYLQSSEELLKHLDTPIPRRSPENSTALKWFVWLAGLTLVISLMAALLLKTVFPVPTDNDTEPSGNQPESRSSQVDPQSSRSGSSPQTDSTASLSSDQTSIPGPDLTDNEFIDVNASNLARLNPSSSTSFPATPPQGSPSTPNSVNPSQTAAPPTGTPGKQYYVVTDYTDDKSLKAAQAIVPTAKAVEFTGGTKVQVGQYASIADAQNAATELRQKGLTITILATPDPE